MGMWNKFKQLKAGIEAVSSTLAPSNRTLHIKGDNDVVVVAGEYFSKNSQRVPVGQQFTVELRREPRNTHDKNAIMVLRMGRQIGYFSAFKAERYAQLLDIAGRNGQQFTRSLVRRKRRTGTRSRTFRCRQFTILLSSSALQPTMSPRLTSRRSRPPLSSLTSTRIN
ncbi:HIRAN domain-containing protein [Pseudarthrobacter sp. LMD1-1-1.1]